MIRNGKLNMSLTSLILDTRKIMSKPDKKELKKSLIYKQFKKTKITPSKTKYSGALGAAFLHNL